MAAFGYALAGGVGAAVLAMVAPMLMHDYTEATSANQALIAAQFAILLDVVWRSVWQLLDRLLIAGWALGLGLLVRVDRPGLYRLVLLAAAATVGTVANVAGFDWARDVMIGVVGTLWAVWWVCYWCCLSAPRSQRPAVPCKQLELLLPVRGDCQAAARRKKVVWRANAAGRRARSGSAARWFPFGTRRCCVPRGCSTGAGPAGSRRSPVLG
jgi:hypothetical protein